jgi:hypothetical protein
MNDQQDAPVAIPWYKSAVLRGLVTIASALIIKVLTAVLKKYQLDLDLGFIDVTADTLTDWIMDGVIPAAIGYAVHGRVTKPSPVVTLTKAKADTINNQPPPPATPAPEEVRK